VRLDGCRSRPLDSGPWHLGLQIAAADDELLLEWMDRISTAESLADVVSG
jgi:hypothetical protein